MGIKTKIDWCDSQRKKILTKQGYVLVWNPNHPNANKGKGKGYIFEHRLVMSEHDNMFDVIPRCEVTKILKQVFDAIRAETDDGPYSIPDFLTEMERAINAIPSVDSELVRHGEWSDYRINGYDGLHPVYETQCSLCGGYARFTYRFCPHCGARMDGGTNGNKQ